MGIDRALASGQVSETVQRVDHAISKGAPISSASWFAAKASLAKLLIPTLLIGVGAGVVIGRRTTAPASAPRILESAPLRAEPPAAAETTMPFEANPPPVSRESARPRSAFHRHKSLRSHELPASEPPLEAAEGFVTSEPVPPAPAGHHVAEELRLMHTASAALSAHDWPRAERALAEHARRFPDGSLSQERHALRLISRCKQGERAKLHSEIGAFLRSAADSPLAVRVREACEDAH
jgi:hypothetical protein